MSLDASFANNGIGHGSTAIMRQLQTALLSVGLDQTLQNADL